MPTQTRHLEVKQVEGWPERVPVTIHPPHYNLNDRVWLVYSRDLIGDYQFYVGEVTIASIMQTRRNALKPGDYNYYRYVFRYQISDAKGQKFLDESEYDTWVSERQLFSTKDEAIIHMRGALLFTLEQDKKRHAKYLAITNDAIQRVKDNTIELRYSPLK